MLFRRAAAVVLALCGLAVGSVGLVIPLEAGAILLTPLLLFCAAALLMAALRLGAPQRSRRSGSRSAMEIRVYAVGLLGLILLIVLL